MRIFDLGCESEIENVAIWNYQTWFGLTPAEPKLNNYDIGNWYRGTLRYELEFHCPSLPGPTKRTFNYSLFTNLLKNDQIPDFTASHALWICAKKYQNPLITIMYTCFETRNVCQWIMSKTIDISSNVTVTFVCAKVNSSNLTKNHKSSKSGILERVL